LEPIGSIPSTESQTRPLTVRIGEILSKVKALEAYARATKQDAEIVLMVQEQKLRSMRILGKLLEETEISKNASNQYLVGNEEVPSKPRQ